jgi:hypothetical protein
MRELSLRVGLTHPGSHAGSGIDRAKQSGNSVARVSPAEIE